MLYFGGHMENPAHGRVGAESKHLAIGSEKDLPRFSLIACDYSGKPRGIALPERRRAGFFPELASDLLRSLLQLVCNCLIQQNPGRNEFFILAFYFFKIPRQNSFQ